MSSMSLFLLEHMLRRTFREEAAFGTHVHVGLVRRVAESNAAGVDLDEPAPELGYARMAIALNTTAFALTGYGEVHNAEVITWPAPTGDWGLIVGWIASTSGQVRGGTLLASGPVNRPARVGFGTRPQLVPGELVFGLRDL